MIEYKCDICGEPIPPTKVMICTGYCSRHNGFQGVLSQKRHVCESCVTVGENLDFEQIIIDAWRKAAREKQAK